jgi:GNAT superfamily N-acetyltransferase
MLIRSFETRDLEQCTKLIKETSEQFNREDFTQWNEKEFFDFFDLKKNKEALIKFFNESTVFVAINQKDEIIWVLRVKENRIKSFFVASKYHRRGVATSLFNYYLEILKDWEYKVITVLSSSYAIKFYESLWFKVNGEDIIREGKVRVTPMKKCLI